MNQIEELKIVVVAIFTGVGMGIISNSFYVGIAGFLAVSIVGAVASAIYRR